MAKKIKRYNGEDESEVKFETKTGKNESISDDIRARAMKFVEKSDEAKKEVTPKSTAVSRKVAAKTETSVPMPDLSNEEAERRGLNEKGAIPVVSDEERKRESQVLANRKAAPRFDPAAAVGVRRPAPAPSFMMKSMGYKSGGKVKSASARADGCAIRGKTRA